MVRLKKWEDSKKSSLIMIDVVSGALINTRVQSLACRADIRTEVAGSGDGGERSGFRLRLMMFQSCQKGA